MGARFWWKFKLRADGKVGDEVAEEKLCLERVRLVQVIENLSVPERFSQLVQINETSVLLESIHFHAMLKVAYIQLLKLCLRVFGHFGDFCDRDQILALSILLIATATIFTHVIAANAITVNLDAPLVAALAVTHFRYLSRNLSQ